MASCGLKEGCTDEYDIFRLKYVPEVDRSAFDTANRNWSVTWSLFYGASLFSQDVCMTSGIDQLLLSDRYFNFIRQDMQPKEDDHVEDKMIVPLADAYKGRGNVSTTFPTSHVVGKGWVFKQIMWIHDEWEEEIKKIFWARHIINFTRGQTWYRLPENCWELDEQYFSVFIRNDKLFGAPRQKGQQKSDFSVLKDGFFEYWHPRRLCRGGNSGGGMRGKRHRYTKQKCQDGYYIELHGDRPLGEFFRGVIDDFMLSENLEKYRLSNRLYDE